MPTTRLLPGEKRHGPTHQPSVEEALTGRSVRSIRQRFEADAALLSASAPSTPAKKRSTRQKHQPQTKTQVELAAFLKAGKDRASNPPTPPPATTPTPSAPSSAVPTSSHVGSLIEKWSSGSTPRLLGSRPPLQERHVQRAGDYDLPPPQNPFHAAAMDSVDTFGSSSVDLDRAIPKTDPGRLESYAAQARHLAQPLKSAAAASALQPASGDQSLKEMVTRGLPLQKRRSPNPSASGSDSDHDSVEHETVLASDVKPQVLHVNREWKIQERIEVFVQESDNSDTRIFKQDVVQTPKHSVISVNNTVTHCPDFKTSGAGSGIIAEGRAGDSSDNSLVVCSSASGNNGLHNDAEPTTSVDGEHNDSDWGAGDVYIRELFSEAEDTAERAVQCDENEDYFSAFELYWTVVDLYSKVIPFLSPSEGVDVHERIKMYTRRCEAIREAFEDDAEDETPAEDDHNEQTNALDSKETCCNNRQIQIGSAPTFANSINLNPAELSSQATASSPHNGSDLNDKRLSPSKEPHEEPIANSAPPAGNSVDVPLSKAKGAISKKKSVHTDGPTGNNELKRTPYPDHSVERPLASIPDAGDPRTRAYVTGGTISASTQAHRNSLSRPISRSAARKSTNSITRQKVAEMQERVNLMQECLNNFTVKQKHLGPARALELAVTTLNANTFGDLKKLEPLAPELEHKWATELEVLLSMLKEIKEVRPGKGYSLREDIAKHLPALEKCDRSVRQTMRSFSALQGHVRYVDRETASSVHGGRGQRRWWVKVPVVEKGGLNEDVLKVVREAEIEMRGVFKICHEINVEIVKDIPIPRSFVESLPRHARSLIPRDLKEGLTTWGMFKVSDYMKDRNIWNKDAAKDIVSSLEKVSLIWEARTTPNKSFFSRTFDIRGERFHQAMTAFRRCQTAIRDLRRDW